MKRPSNTTVKRRIMEQRCPFCGCGRRRFQDFHCEYPERAIYERCDNCGKLLIYTDNSPWYSLFEELGKVKAISIEKVRKIYKHFVP